MKYKVVIFDLGIVVVFANSMTTKVVVNDYFFLLSDDNILMSRGASVCQICVKTSIDTWILNK